MAQQLFDQVPSLYTASHVPLDRPDGRPPFQVQDELHVDLDSLLPSLLRPVETPPGGPSRRVPMTDLAPCVDAVMAFLAALERRLKGSVGPVVLYQGWGMDCRWTEQRRASLLADDTLLFFVELSRRLSQAGATHGEQQRAAFYSVRASDGASSGFAAASAVHARKRRHAAQSLVGSAPMSLMEALASNRMHTAAPLMGRRPRVLLVSERDEAAWFGVDVVRNVVPWAMTGPAAAGIGGTAPSPSPPLLCYSPSLLAGVLFAQFRCIGDGTVLSQLGTVLHIANRHQQHPPPPGAIAPAAVPINLVLRLAMAIGLTNHHAFTRPLVDQMRLELAVGGYTFPDDVWRLSSVHALHQTFTPGCDAAAGTSSSFAKTAPLVVEGIEKGLCGGWPLTLMAHHTVVAVPSLHRCDPFAPHHVFLSHSEMLLWGALAGGAGGAMVVEEEDAHGQPVLQIQALPSKTAVASLVSEAKLQAGTGQSALGTALSINTVWPLRRDYSTTDTLRSMLPFLRIADARDPMVLAGLQLHHIDGLSRPDIMCRLAVLSLMLLRAGKYVLQWEWSILLAAVVAAKPMPAGGIHAAAGSVLYVYRAPPINGTSTLHALRRAAGLFCRVLTHVTQLNDLYNQALTLSRDRRQVVTLAALLPVLQHLEVSTTTAAASSSSGSPSEGVDVEQWYLAVGREVGLYNVWLQDGHHAASDYAACFQLVAACTI